MKNEHQSTTWLDRAKSPVGIAAGIAIVAVLAVVGLSSLPSDKSRAAQYHIVEKGDFLVSIVEGGTLEAVNEVVIRNEVDGTSRIIYIVPEGSQVKKGDLLVELDSADAQEKVNQQQISLEKAQAAYVQAQNNLLIQQSIVESEVDAARLKYEFAEIEFKKFMEGERTQLHRNAEIEIQKVEESLMLAREDLDWSKKLFQQGFETKTKVDRDELSVMEQSLRLEQARTNSWMLQTFDLPKMERQFRSDVEETAKELERVQQQGKNKLVGFESDLITQSNTLQFTKQKLENDSKQLENSKIYAPQDGFVVYAVGQSRFSSESLIEEGAQVRNRQELIKLPDTSKMKVDIKVHESHINKLAVGKTAFVVLDSLPDKRFKGVVTKVAPLPDTQSRWGNPNLKVYSTQIVITDPLPDLKPGISANAEIIITNIPNAITVPIQALTTAGGETVVYKASGGDPQPVPVKVGLFNTRFIEITSGVEEGDRILLAPPLAADQKDIGGGIIGLDEEVSDEDLKPDPDAVPKNIAPAESREPGGRGGGEGRGGRGAGAGGGGAGGGGFDREAMMKRFDKNGDGTLDESERAAMRQQFQQGGGDGGGGGGNRQRGEGGGERQGRNRPTGE